MEAAVKELWVAALARSPRACRSHLRIRDRYSPLGLLCELHRRESGGSWIPCRGRAYAYRGGVVSPPDEVLRWAGVREADAGLVTQVFLDEHLKLEQVATVVRELL